MISTSEFIYPDIHIDTVKVSFWGRTVGSIGVDSRFYETIEIGRTINSNTQLMQLIIDKLYCDYEHVWIFRIDTDVIVYDCPSQGAKGNWRWK